jgi:hypothetical protein
MPADLGQSIEYREELCNGPKTSSMATYRSRTAQELTSPCTARSSQHRIEGVAWKGSHPLRKANLMKRRAYGRWWDTRAEAGQSRRAIRPPQQSHLTRWSDEFRAASRLMSEFSRNVRRSIPKPWFRVDPAKLKTHQEKRSIRAAERAMAKWTGVA